MDKEGVESYFKQVFADQPEVSHAVAALQTLMEFMKRDTSETLQELNKNILNAVETLTSLDISVTSVKSACELFMRFITLTALDHSDFMRCKEVLALRGTVFLEKVSSARTKIAQHGNRFIIDGSKILTHSHSQVVLHTLLEAARAKKRFHVYVTQSAPNNSGEEMYKKLVAAGILATLILDSAMAYVLENVDMVLVGAEAVALSGGIINKIGTYGIALCAKAMKKNFYVLAESFKFLRIYPLNNTRLPDSFKYKQNAKGDLSKEHPLVDYTPPSYITLLFTDLGILTPSAVSDELIKLYC